MTITPLEPVNFSVIKKLEKASRRVFALRLKIHSLKEAHKNFLNREIGYRWFYWTFNLAYWLTVGYLTFISDLKLENLGLQRFRRIKIVLFISSTPRKLGSIVLFQPLAKWAGSSQERIKQLRVGSRASFLFAIIRAVYYARYEAQSSERIRMIWFYYSVKLHERDRKRYISYLPHPMQHRLLNLESDKKSYEIVLTWTMEAENFKDDFDQIWNLDDEIFYQIDVYGTEDIKTQIHKLQQNTVTETTQDE